MGAWGKIRKAVKRYKEPLIATAVGGPMLGSLYAAGQGAYKGLSNQYKPGEVGGIDPYAYDTPGQGAERGRLEALLAQGSRVPGMDITAEEYARYFDPAKNRLEGTFAERGRSYDEQMSARGLLSRGSFAGGEKVVAGSEPYGYGKGLLEREYSQELGNVSLEAQQQAQQVRLQEREQALKEYATNLEAYLRTVVDPNEAAKVQAALATAQAELDDAAKARITGLIQGIAGGAAQGAGAGIAGAMM
jgi:hypothetical protein